MNKEVLERFVRAARRWVLEGRLDGDGNRSSWPGGSWFLLSYDEDGEPVRMGIFPDADFPSAGGQATGTVAVQWDKGVWFWADGGEWVSIHDAGRVHPLCFCPVCESVKMEHGIDGCCSFNCAMTRRTRPHDFREEPGDTRREREEASKAVSVEDSGEGTDGLESPLPTSPYLEERFEKFLGLLRSKSSAPAIFLQGLLRDAFLAGVDAKGDQITERQMREDLESRPPGMVDDRTPASLPIYDSVVRRLCETEHPDEWSYSLKVLVENPGVMMVAQLYQVPVVRVARDVASMRREWVKRYLAEAG